MTNTGPKLYNIIYYLLLFRLAIAIECLLHLAIALEWFFLCPHRLSLDMTFDQETHRII